MPCAQLACRDREEQRLASRSLRQLVTRCILARGLAALLQRPAIDAITPTEKKRDVKSSAMRGATSSHEPSHEQHG